MFLSLKPPLIFLSHPRVSDGEATQEEILVKVTNQRHWLTKRLKYNWNIIEDFPTLTTYDHTNGVPV